MKRSIPTFAAIVLGCCIGLTAQASTKTSNQTASKAGSKAAPAKPLKAPVKKAAKSGAAKQVCSTRKIKTAKGWKTERSCVAPERVEPSLQSPIQKNALEKPAVDSAEVKVRSAPDRAYAVDGSSFFYQGRRYRVAGMDKAEGSDMAMQRLQKTLESGSLMIDPLSTDENGVSTATVRVNGRDIADQLR